MKYINTEKTIIKSWCNNPEESALQQARNLANLPFVFKQVCLMPDTHSGYGMPIGGVIACENVVIPNAVGVDIGCGMSAVKTSLKTEDLSEELIKKIMNDVREKIPLGMKHHKEDQGEDSVPKLSTQKNYPIVRQEYQSARYQISSLGSGNHFWELQKDEENNIWLMIHSGSRNIGYKVAKHYNELAKQLNQRWFSQVPKEWDLAFLPIDAEEAKMYLDEMEYCLEFAFLNRKLMILKTLDSINKYIKCEAKDNFNIHHNYAKYENHFGKNVIVHRKGATSAREGEIGIIPGSQGASSYIVRGLGNPESFMSCSHGAGRKIGRKEACRTLNLQDEIKKLDDKGIIHSIRSQEDLDEAAGSYKDINIVMDEQKDLVEILVKLEPLAVIKG